MTFKLASSQSCRPIATCNFWNCIYINYIEINISSSVVTAKFLMLRSETWKCLSYETAKIWNHSNDCYVFNYYSTSTLTTDTPSWIEELITPGLPLVFLISLDHIWILLVAHSEKFTLTSEFLIALSCLLANVHNSPRIEELVEISLMQHYHNGFLVFTSTFTSLWYIFHKIVKVIFKKNEKERNQNETFLWNGSNPSKGFPIQD